MNREGLINAIVEAYKPEVPPKPPAFKPGVKTAAPKFSTHNANKQIRRDFSAKANSGKLTAKKAPAIQRPDGSTGW